MTTLTDTGMATLADITAVLGPDSKEVQITNLLTKLNPFLAVLPWKEANMSTGHKLKQTGTSLASATWRLINQGVTPTKSDVTTYTETCGILEREIPIDEELLSLNGGAAYMMKEVRLGIEGINQQLMTALLYESTLNNPERILGLTPRFPASTGYDTSGQVIVGSPGGTSDNAHSVWLVTPGEHLFGIYPKGSKAGLQTIDRGEQRFADQTALSGNADPLNVKYYYGKATTLKWHVGLVVDDYRYISRGQWDPDDANMADNERGLEFMMDDMLYTHYQVQPGSRWLMNRTTAKKLNKQIKSGPGNDMIRWAMHEQKLMGPSDLGHVFAGQYAGIPILITDSLVAETQIS